MQAMQTISRINNILKWANYVKTEASKVKIDSYDGARYTQHSAKYHFSDNISDIDGMR